jgi:hypothetical protein
MSRKRPLLVLVILLALSIVTATIIEFISGSASSAGTPTTKSTRPGTSTSTPQIRVPGGSLSYRTTGTHVRIRQAPTATSAIVTTLGSTGTSVSLTCYLTGQSVFGDAYWYRATYSGASSDDHGYIAGYWLNTGPDPAENALPHC